MVIIRNFGSILEQSVRTTILSPLYGETISDTANKANALNNYFQLVFTKESLTNIPSMNECDNPVNLLPTMPSITFSVAGIQHQLSLLDTNKASGPDNIHPCILYI